MLGIEREPYLAIIFRDGSAHLLPFREIFYVWTGHQNLTGFNNTCAARPKEQQTISTYWAIICWHLPRLIRPEPMAKAIFPPPINPIRSSSLAIVSLFV